MRASILSSGKGLPNTCGEVHVVFTLQSILQFLRSTVVKSMVATDYLVRSISLWELKPSNLHSKKIITGGKKSLKNNEDADKKLRINRRKAIKEGEEALEEMEGEIYLAGGFKPLENSPQNVAAPCY